MHKTRSMTSPERTSIREASPAAATCSRVMSTTVGRSRTRRRPVGTGGEAVLVVGGFSCVMQLDQLSSLEPMLLNSVVRR